MKLLLLLSVMMATVFCSCSGRDDYEFGSKYNPVRQKFGSPSIKKNMVVKSRFIMTLYEIDAVPTGNKAYHASKTVRAVTDGKISEEKDIYRESIDDTTLVQVNILSRWIWEENRVSFRGSIGKIDKRSLDLKAGESIRELSKYPDYQHMDLNLVQIDSALKEWGLSRFDNY